MADRKNIASGSEWEEQVGYSRAVRVGNIIAVAGTTAPGPDAYHQACGAIQRVADALDDAGARLEDVIRTRMFVVDIEKNWRDVGRAHAEFFDRIRPAATMVEVSRLISPGLLVEIEADALLASSD